MVAVTMTLKQVQELIFALLDFSPQDNIPVITFYKMLFTILTENRQAREALSAAFKEKYQH